MPGYIQIQAFFFAKRRRRNLCVRCAEVCAQVCKRCVCTGVRYGSKADTKKNCRRTSLLKKIGEGRKRLKTLAFCPRIRDGFTCKEL